MQNLEKSMISKLIETAMEQLKFSYTPYSNFKVGASLLTKNGQIYTGCNIENCSSFCTVRRCICCIFNVTPCINLSVFCK